MPLVVFLNGGEDPLFGDTDGVGLVESLVENVLLRGRDTGVVSTDNLSAIF